MDDEIGSVDIEVFCDILRFSSFAAIFPTLKSILKVIM
jgi:hypothetical protein